MPGAVAIGVVCATLAGCSGPPPEALRLSGNLLTVDNQPSND